MLTRMIRKVFGLETIEMENQHCELVQRLDKLIKDKEDGKIKIRIERKWDGGERRKGNGEGE